MEAAFIEIGKQIPAVAALIYLVVKFLGALEKRDDTLNKIRQEWLEGMKITVNSCTDVINRNTDAMMKFHGIISHCAMVPGQSDKKED